MTLSELAKNLKIEVIEAPGARSNYHRNRALRAGGPLRYSYGAILRLARPTSEADIAKAAFDIGAVCDWAGKNGWTVRALGSGWSFSDVMAPGAQLNDTKSILVETSAFKLVPLRAQSDPKLAYITAGANLHNLNRALERRGLSLKTSGSSDGQTIAGALGTGVHGSAFRFGALYDSVRAYHLAIPGEHVLVCRSDAAFAPALQKEFQNRLDIPRIIVDASLFDAVSVSFGSFGVVVGVVAEVAPRYALKVIRRTFPAARVSDLVQVLRGAGDFGSLDAKLKPDDPADIPHHCQLLVNPYDNTNYRIVVMYERQGYSPTAPFEWPDVFDPAGVELINFLWSVVGHGDAFFGDLISGKFNSLPDVDAWGFRSEVFGTPEQPLPVHSVGIGVPLDQLQRALAVAHNVVQREKFPGASEIRFVKKSDGLLGINRFGPVTAVLGFDGLDIDDSWEFSRLLYSELRNANVPLAFHWGKMTDLGDDPQQNLALLTSMYGISLKAWRDARASLLGGRARVFDNAFLRRLGIG